jgi:hypothetical protein
VLLPQDVVDQGGLAGALQRGAAAQQ